MKTSGFDEQQFEKMKTHPGFIAALDQSGGSTPGALRLYGIREIAWSNEDEMFVLVHQMRTRVITRESDGNRETGRPRPHVSKIISERDSRYGRG